ncbi:hypothetical protein [Anabaena sp. UHCC 0399]|uniref:hypothetical protein n=1 Tax=Anabaena sp. UHCC 0399 TaxID=3110238 RepID=UPI002B1F1B63|nr:hypothetical protein [Anabaena sp. UHCC 0399]MEA5568836.1 hypothetical protein [Anabaena sp. UHCC 0399]
MGLPITVSFMLPAWIAKGLADGTFERVGGVIREVGSKRVITWLRDFSPSASQGMSLALNPVNGVLNLIVSGANAAISAKGFADVNQRLGGIENQLNNIQQTLQLTQGMLQITTAASVLNLGVSVIGFTIIAHRLKEIEHKLQQSQELLNKINRKVDLVAYANFHAGIELAINAFTMNNIENRRNSALQAINRFLEAEHIYKDYTVNEMSHKSHVISQYILTLSLAYIAEARCYLELEERETATRRFQEGTKIIRLLINKYIEIMLTSNPAVYLHPQFKDQIDLRRVTKIYQWINPNLDENAVFDLQRENLFKIAQDSNHWLSSLPSAIVDRGEIQWGIFGANPTPLTGRFEKEAYKRLPQILENIESIIETNHRFESYQTEIQAISQLGISFHEWLKLTPIENQANGAELMYIIPSTPLQISLPI